MSAASALILPKVTFAPSLWNKYHKVRVVKSTISQELLNFHLDSRANWKISKRRFFGDFLNSFNWVTQIGPKTTQKIFFENISKTTGATVVQNFGILDGAADMLVEIWPKFFCQFSAVMWWTFAENFNEISQTVFEQSSIYWKILDAIRLSSVNFCWK